MGLFELLILILILGFFFTGYRGRDWGYTPVGGIIGLIVLLIILRAFHVI